MTSKKEKKFEVIKKDSTPEEYKTARKKISKKYNISEEEASKMITETTTSIDDFSSEEMIEMYKKCLEFIKEKECDRRMFFSIIESFSLNLLCNTLASRCKDENEFKQYLEQYIDTLKGTYNEWFKNDITQELRNMMRDNNDI